MQYMRSLQFIWDRKNWMSNILMSGLCMLIPIIGPIVLNGWLFEVIESLHRDPEHRDYPDFDFNQFTNYLSRGIWPFLVALIVNVLIAIPLGLAYMVVIVLAITAGPKAGALIAVVYVVFMLLVALISFASVFIMWPATLQAGLSREFNFSRIVAFVKDFNRRVFKELFVATLFSFVVALLLMPLGLLLFCVGVYFTVAAVVMSQHHLQFQLYELYLKRGGTPISGPSVARVRPVDDDFLPEPPPHSEGDERFRAGP